MLSIQKEGQTTKDMEKTPEGQGETGEEGHEGRGVVEGELRKCMQLKIPYRGNYLFSSCRSHYSLKTSFRTAGCLPGEPLQCVSLILIQYGKCNRLGETHIDILCVAVVLLFVDFMHLFGYVRGVWKLIQFSACYT